MFAKIFDTYKSSSALESFIETKLTDLKFGDIIIAACKDECSSNLSDKVK